MLTKIFVLSTLVVPNSPFPGIVHLLDISIVVYYTELQSLELYKKSYAASYIPTKIAKTAYDVVEICLESYF